MTGYVLHGPLLNPLASGSVDYFADGALACDEQGRIAYVGEIAGCRCPWPVRQSAGVILPPLLDCHIHIPQHPIRGQFMAGVGADPPEGRLLAGLYRNVFPEEGKSRDVSYADAVIRRFLEDTLAQGVVGGAAYMTVHAAAAERALEILPPAWHVGLVLMEQHCPEYLRTNLATLDDDVARMAERFGNRLIVTDRFAAAVSSPLRQRAAALATKHGLRMQTHLSEQIKEKRFVESLYPHSKNYTQVYADDGLLDRQAIMAHCIWMTDDELSLIRDRGSSIAHCPVSNTLLGSGIMPLDCVLKLGVPYAICTDVGASPTTSLLCEMAQFLKVHAERHADATPQEALYRTTQGAAEMLGLAGELGTFAVGKPCSYIEVAAPASPAATVDEAILAILGTSESRLTEFAHANRAALAELRARGLDLGPGLQVLTTDVEQTAKAAESRVRRVTLAGKAVWQRDQFVESPPRA